MTAVFISYRRNDAGHAKSLFDRLEPWFEPGALFYDQDSIDPGQPFPQRLADGIAAARAVLVVMGPGWLDEINRRAALPETDFVRREVELALARRAQPDAPVVIPVLMGGCAPPAAADFDARLRETLAPLCALDMHCFQGKNADWNNQFVRLRQLIAAVPGMPPLRYRAPPEASRPFSTLGHRPSPHFQDPLGLLGRLHDGLQRSGTLGRARARGRVRHGRRGQDAAGAAVQPRLPRPVRGGVVVAR
jgi:hypothetical protein